MDKYTINGLDSVLEFNFLNFFSSDADCCIVGDKCYVIGGFNGFKCHKNGEYFDFVQQNWYPMTNRLFNVLNYNNFLVCL